MSPVKPTRCPRIRVDNGRIVARELEGFYHARKGIIEALQVERI
jgi:hypothetical protein